MSDKLIYIVYNYYYNIIYCEYYMCIIYNIIKHNTELNINLI